MHKQPIDLAFSTADLLSGLTADEPKSSLADLLASTGQVAAALSLCWVIHILV